MLLILTTCSVVHLYYNNKVCHKWQVYQSAITVYGVTSPAMLSQLHYLPCLDIDADQMRSSTVDPVFVFFSAALCQELS